MLSSIWPSYEMLSKLGYKRIRYNALSLRFEISKNYSNGTFGPIMLNYS